jgi:cell division septation protein DedD
MLIEPTLIHEAITSLGIETPVPDVTVARIETRVEKRVSMPVEIKPASAEIKPAPVVEIVKPSSVPVTHLSGSPQILSEFAAEADLAGPLSGVRSRKLAVALLILALLAAGSAAAWFLSVETSAVDVETSVLPARPTWTAAAQTALPPVRTIAGELGASTSPPAAVQANDGTFAIQVASFSSQTRADRLVTELAQAGFRARTVEFNLGPPRGLVLQIRVDGYPSVQDAERDLTRIRELPGYGDAHLLAN